MATVTFNRNDLENLLGKEISEVEYRDLLPMFGTPLEGIEGDKVEFEVFPNRPDLLAVEGFARALQGFFGIKKGMPKYEVKKSDYEVIVEDEELLDKRGHVVFAVVKGVQFDNEGIEAFMQLQDKLSITIGRRRKKCSLGTYDLDELEFPLKYKEVGLDFKFTPLGFPDEKMTVSEVLEKHPKAMEFKHMTKDWKKYPVYFDAKDRPMCLLPFTNAEFAKIKDTTQNIFIEVTGIDWKSATELLNIMVTALAERGGEIYEMTATFPKDIGKGTKHTTPDLTPYEMKLDIPYINKLLDLDLKQKEVEEALSVMRLDVKGDKVIIPAYRSDIMHPIDIVEEVALGHGYEKFEPRIPKIPTMGKPYDQNEFDNKLREIMVGLGFQETVSFVLSNPKKEFENTRLEPVPVVEISNPKTEDYTIARHSILPSLLEIFRMNASTEMPQKIFEVGICVQLDDKYDTGARNVHKIGGAALHSHAGYSELRAYVDTLGTALGKTVSYEPLDSPLYLEGRSASILLDGEKVGEMGEVHPEVLSNFEIQYPVVSFECNAEKLKVEETSV